MQALNPKKIFKEKKTVKGELEKALENGIKINYSTIAKAVGISIHRVKKYCKNHNIDIDNYNNDTLQQPKIVEKKDVKQKKKKVILEQNLSTKIDVGVPVEVKFKL